MFITGVIENVCWAYFRHAGRETVLTCHVDPYQVVCVVVGSPHKYEMLTDLRGVTKTAPCLLSLAKLSTQMHCHLPSAPNPRMIKNDKKKNC
jgi:hypothetical protein